MSRPIFSAFLVAFDLMHHSYITIVELVKNVFILQGG